MNGQPLFCVDELRIQYPFSETWAVDRVSFTLQRGEKLGLVGESGCGKSTMGKAAMGLLPKLTQIEGKIEFQGESIFGLNAEGLRKFRGEVVGLVFQDPMTRLDPLMTIGEHCIETLQAHRPQLSRKEAKTIAIKTLEKVNIPPNRWGQYPHEFSGGMRQRVAMALALLLNPKMIIADEPTTALDVTVAAEILQELTRLCEEEEMGLLLISHDLAMVAEYCDRLAVMNGGKIVEMGNMADILHHPQHDYTKSLLKAALHVQVEDDEPINIDSWEEDKPTKKALLTVNHLKQYFTLEGNFIQQFFSKEPEVIKAVDDVSFELYSGEILGLVGESGCGKSTLSRTLYSY